MLEKLNYIFATCDLCPKTSSSVHLLNEHPFYQLQDMTCHVSCSNWKSGECKQDAFPIQDTCGSL